MKITDPAQVKVGQWSTICCEDDLQQITNEEELDQVRADMEDGIARVWESQEEALNAIKASKLPYDPTALLDR